MQTGENYHRSSNTLSLYLVYIVLVFAVKYKFMTLWLNTTMKSSIWTPFNLGQSLTNSEDLPRSFNGRGVESRFAPRV